MKWIIIFAIFIITLVTTPSMVFAQPMMGTQSAGSSDGHTARAALADEGEPRLDHTRREEQEGKEIWGKLQAKQITCDKLADNDFGALGEYFMGQMIGSSHEAMNNMMERMMGKDGEEQMHVVMGKRLSGCDTSAQLPQNGIGFMPMMPPLASLALLGGWMMGSVFAPESFGGTRGGGNPMMWGGMMNGWGGFGVLGWLSMLIFWALLILGVIALIRYLGGSGKRSDEGKSPLDILKERYARGEIDKKEFEEMKKDLR